MDRTMETVRDAFWRFLGLAVKAGRVAAGSDALETGIRSGKVCLAILTIDAGPNTRDKIGRLCAHYNVPLLVMGDRSTLGHWTGKKERVAVGVTDPGFGKRLVEIAESQSMKQSTEPSGHAPAEPEAKNLEDKA